MPRNEDDFPAQHIVPDGRRNAIGVRWWREFYRDLLENIQTAVSAATAAANAQTTAGGAVTTAANAQDAADAAQTDIDGHVVAAATPTELGHVLQSGAFVGPTTATVGASGLVYNQAYADQQTARANDAHTRLDDLTAKLQAAGIIQ